MNEFLLDPRFVRPHNICQLIPLQGDPYGKTLLEPAVGYYIMALLNDPIRFYEVCKET